MTKLSAPWHGARFKIATGEARGAPAYENAVRYNVRVSGDDVEVEV